MGKQCAGREELRMQDASSPDNQPLGSQTDISPRTQRQPTGTWREAQGHWLFSSVHSLSRGLTLGDPMDARPPCKPPTHGVHPISCPLSRWCHPTISSSVIPFSSSPQSFPASGHSQGFVLGGPLLGRVGGENSKQYICTFSEIKYFCHNKVPLCPFQSVLSRWPPILETTDMISVSLVVSFLLCPIHGIKHRQLSVTNFSI